MSKNHGNILIFIGVMHSLFGLTPWAFGSSISKFANSFFFNINSGLSDFPLLGGEIQSADFAAFWFLYFGLLLIPLGILLQQFINQQAFVPRTFSLAYLIMVIIGGYMIPFSGMTIIMLPHALLMLKQSKSISSVTNENNSI